MFLYKKFYPKKIFKNLLQIDINFLRQNNIKAIFLDIDNTIMDYDGNIIEGLENWVENLKDYGIKFCIVSNTSKKEKAERVSNLLKIPFINLSTKPLRRGLKKAKKIIKIYDDSVIAVVGDQVMTDVWGANRCKMFSILVEPIKDKDILVTRFNRIFERIILKEYYKNNKEE